MYFVWREYDSDVPCDAVMYGLFGRGRLLPRGLFG